ncbi:MAG TPA: prenyltransferase/squalene oxidase repeat-containing protein [Pirellulales bacterium]|nr:prenyltransferase/squalene oxidase repeat-containing protein [Pirellulales bacterium]
MAQKKQSPAWLPRGDAPPRVAEFDEQLWPVNVLLFMFAACVAAVIVVYSDFAAPRWLANGWCHLGALAAIVMALAWGIARLGRRGQRRMQLGVFLSLLVHLWLSLLSCNVYLSAIAQREKDAVESVLEEPAPVTLPDYHQAEEATDDITDPTLNTPVEMPLPETEQEIERTEETKKEQERPAEIEPELRALPTTVSLDRAEMSAPRRADEMGGQQISRQERRLADTSEQAAMPQIEEGREQVTESSVRVERSESRSEQERQQIATNLPTSEPDVRSPTRQATQEMAPAAEAMSVQRAQVTATLRDSARPTTDPIKESAQVQPLVTAQRDVQRSDVSPRLARPSQPTREPSVVSVETAERRPRQPNSPALPRVDSRASAQPARASRPTEVASATVAATAGQATAAPLSEPTETRVEHVGRTAAALPDASAQPSTDSVARANSAVAMRSDAVPRMADEAPSLASSSPSRPTSRSMSMAGQRESDGPESGGMPTAESTASSSQSTAPSAADVEAATASVSKAAGGVAGLTRQQNLDTELPGTGLAAQAQSAARRPQATQAFDAGSESAPSAPARVAKARAAAEAPTASMPADDIFAADMAGAKLPAEQEASSSAVVARMASTAPRAQRTAATGASTIDQGSPQIRSPIGEGRTSGGGEPSLSRDDLPVRVAKAASAASVAGNSRPLDVDVPGASAGGNPSSEPMPATAAIGRSAPAPPAIASAGTMAGSMERADLAVGVAADSVRRQEQAPDGGLPSVRGAESRSRSEGNVDGQVELAAAFQVASPAGGAAGEPGDSEPASASDVVRQTTTGLPTRNTATEMGDGAPFAANAVPIGSNSARRTVGAPSIDEGGTSGASRARTAGPAGTGDTAVPEALVGSVAGGSAKGELTTMDELGHARRPAALPVLAPAAPGTGGLGPELALDLGLPSRRARPESESAHLGSGRLILERSGANRAAEIRVQDVAVPGFRQRDRQHREELARERGGSEGSERAVEMGLDFLARHQNVDGSWSLQKFSQGRPGYENSGDGQMVSDTAATGLGLLAFLGAGYTHTDGKYRLVVARGLNYLLGNQRADGDLFLPQDGKSNVNVWLYSHGIASIALCEAYGMTRDPELGQPAQRALDFIVYAQHPIDGGWRYSPRQGSDTSVSGWQLMALKSGELAGLRVPAATYTKVSHWLDGARAKSNQAEYVYRPKSTHAHQQTASRVMTAEALLMRQYLGWKRDNPLMTAGADLLLRELPEWSIKPDWQRDSYYWYYATQVMFQMGGPHWDAWNERLRPLLVDKQISDGPLAGSWEPLGDVPDRWGREGGRIYVTAMHLLMLEVYYRHLPLYRTLDE